MCGRQSGGLGGVGASSHAACCKGNPWSMAPGKDARTPTAAAVSEAHLASCTRGRRRPRSARARCTAVSDRRSPSRYGRVVATQRGDARSDLSRARSARTSRALASERAKTVCRGGLLHPDLQERAETTTASSDCRPRPTAPDPVASRGNSQSLICARQHVKHGFGTHNVPKPGITGARGDSQVSGKEWFICMLRLGEGRPPTQRSPTSAARSYL